MGQRGPAPKRSSKRLGHVAKAERAAVEKAPTASTVTIPPADSSWYPPTIRWYESLARSGQSAFYTASDWDTAWMLADAMSREFKPQPLVVGSGKDATVQMVSLPPKAASLAAWAKIMSGLLVTEGDRRRVRLELERPVEEAKADVSELDEYRRRLGSSG